MSSLMERMQESGSIKSSILSKSAFFNKKDIIPTRIPIINAAFSGALTGGITSGLTVVAGPSKHYKSNLCLVGVRAYFETYPESVCLFYDSEFGITPEYMKSNGVDAGRVIHIPIENIEQLKFDIVKRLNEIKRGDKVIILMDSVGNLASIKEVEDAENEKSVADMTRAKSLKSLFRIVTPHLTTKDIPCLVVNHTYLEQSSMPREILAGGRGLFYSANTIFIIGRQQEKEGTEVVGWNFVLNVEKSRFVKEKSKLTFLVTYDGGINKWSGLLDLALEYGTVIKPSNGWYQRVGEEQKYRMKDTNTAAFWKPLLEDKQFLEWVEAKYSLRSPVLTDELIYEQGEE